MPVRFIVLVTLTLGCATEIIQSSDQEKLFGGVDVSSTEYAFAGEILITNGTAARPCTGSLIDSNTIATAAHCIQGIERADQVAALFPLHSPSQFYYARAIAVHQAWLADLVAHGCNANIAADSWTSWNDIALIRLDESVTDVQPVSLFGRHARVDDSGEALGFASSGAERPLQRLGMKVERTGTLFFVARDQDEESRGGTCQSDSGGPFLIEGQLAGITAGAAPSSSSSGGPGCSDAGSYFTSIAAHAAWMIDTKPLLDAAGEGELIGDTTCFRAAP